ncbi:MAG: MarR family transcriptional regulator [Coriobacteriia bacterium]|nr:MarR family transcriptional regulator [Coriobacteriia bacterium]
MHCIAHYGGAVTPGQIGDVMNVSSARIAQTLNSIEKKGLITREIDVNDRRKVLVTLTPAGAKAAEEHLRTITELATKMLTLLGEEDAKEYVRITGKLADIFERESLCCN